MNKNLKKRLIRIIVVFAVFILLMILNAAGVLEALPGWLEFAVYFIPYLAIGYDVIIRAAKNISHGQVFDENFLMMIATFAAFALGILGDGEYPEALAVMLFYQTGELFQDYAVGRSRASITAMMEIAPEYANFINEDGSVEQKDPEDIHTGDMILVKPGERVPLDGTVTDGESFLDTAALTGESVPRRAGAGDMVISGCINGSGTLRVRVEKEYEDSTVSKILELVEESGEKKGRTEKFITRFARIYTPIVTIGAVVLALVLPLFFDTSWTEGISRACNFLIVSCPCALVISVPLGFFGGIGAASKTGVLIKGSNYLEVASQLGVVVMDKTGTVTKGEFKVRQTEASAGFTQEDVLRLAAAAERYSNHPIARSILEAYNGSGYEQKNKTEIKEPDEEQAAGVTKNGENTAADAAKTAGYVNENSGNMAAGIAGTGPERAAGVSETGENQITDVTETAGYGIEALYEGKKLLVGSERLLAGNGIKFEKNTGSGTVVYVAYDGKSAGSICIDDEIKESACRMIAGLNACGIAKTVMLTGDHAGAAGKVAESVGISEVRAELLPADKVSEVENLLEGLHTGGSKKKLAFIGDGINDAPVLMRADLGIAMGSLGSDAAIEAADIVIMDDDLSKVPKVIRIAKKTMTIVRSNIVFAIAVKVLVLVLSVFGIASMWLAVFADVGVAMLCVLNSMRALNVRIKS